MTAVLGCMSCLFARKRVYSLPQLLLSANTPAGQPCSMSTELRAAQLRLGDAETQLARRAEEAQVCLGACIMEGQPARLASHACCHRPLFCGIPCLLQRRDAELAELRGIVGALDAERDALQAELDRRAEAAAGEASAMAAERQRAEETQR